MNDFNIYFKDNMLVYAAENVEYPSSTLKVTIPELFLDKETKSYRNRRLSKGNIMIYLNEYPPALQNSVITKNYIELPVASSCRFYDVHIGDKFLASFIGNSPTNGVILARC